MSEEELAYNLDIMDISSSISLTNLATEILLKIFDYLPSSFLCSTVRLVCKRFADVLKDDNYFKVRFKRTYQKNDDEEDNPIFKSFGLVDEGGNVKRDHQLSWSEVTVQAELWDRLFTEKTYTCSRRRWHTATVDAVKVVGGLVVTGGRDKLLCAWDLEAENESPPRACRQGAHVGWIWDIVSHRPEEVITCGWEVLIKEWSLQTGIQLIRSYKTDRPAMRLACASGLLLAGLQSGKVVLFDSRSSSDAVSSTYTAHRGTVTGLEVSGNWVLSVGEDRRLVAADLRKMERQSELVSMGACPRSSAVHAGLWYVGDSKGELIVYDIGSWERPIYTRTLSPGVAINALHPSLEGLITGSSDGGLRFLPTQNYLQPLEEFTFPGGVTALDCHKNVLAAGTAEFGAYFFTMTTNDYLFTR